MRLNYKKMLQWHTPAPSNVKIEATPRFSRFKDSDVIFPLANPAELDRLEEFIDELEVAEYVPSRPYQELKQSLLNPPIFATHVQLFVMTAKLSELRREGLIKSEPAPSFRSIIYPGYDSSTIANEPCSTVPRYMPQLAYGIESVVSPNLVRAYHRCCKLDVSHPGCWYGPVKYQITPWIITSPGLNQLKNKTDIVNGLRIPIVRGTYWLKDPMDQVMQLRRKLENEIADAILSNGELSIDYFTLLELTHNKDFVNSDAQLTPPQSPQPQPQSPPPPPPPPAEEEETEEPEDPLYLELIAKIDEYSQLGADIDSMNRLYDGYFIGPDLIDAKTNIIRLRTLGKTLSHDLLVQIKNSIESIDRAKLQILKDSADAPPTADALKKATVVGAAEVIQLLKLKARVDAAALGLGVVAPVIVVPSIEDAYSKYVEANKATIPVPPGVVPTYQLAYDYFLTGVIDMTQLQPREVNIAPYGANVGGPSFPYSTGNQFKWDKDSCWFDSVFTALFSIPNSPWEQEIRNATKMYIKVDCNAEDFRSAIIRDIEYLQREPDSTPIKTSEAIHFFEKCVANPQKLNNLEYPHVTFSNLKSLFKLSESIQLRELGDIQPHYITFAAIVSRPGHFVSYIRQPDGRWIRLDDIADPSERVLYFDRVNDGKLVLKNKDIPGEKFEFEERIVFFLDMREDEWKQMIRLTPKDVLKHWKDIRNRQNLLQPVYLTDQQKKLRESNTKPSKKIASHNKTLFDDLDTFIEVVRSINDGTFNYSKYPDIANNVRLPEPVDFTSQLKNLISVFNVINVGPDPHDEKSYYRLLRLAIKPRFASIIMKTEANQPMLAPTGIEQAYLAEDEAEMLAILRYFFNEGPPVKGKVMEI